MHKSLIVGIYFSIFAIAITCNSFAQVTESKILHYDTTSRHGLVRLVDGTQLKGRVTFHDSDGMVRVHFDNESKAFTSNDLLMFQFYDPRFIRNRQFLSLLFDDPETGTHEYEFFELIKELKDFAVLIKIDRVVSKSSTTQSMRPLPTGLTDGSALRHRELSQTRTVYFLNTTGNFEAYLKITEIERSNDGLELDFFKHKRDKVKLINAELFKKYTGPYFKELLDFADANRLSLKNIGDLKVVLDEYERLQE